MKARVILIFWVPGAADGGEAERGAAALRDRLLREQKATFVHTIQVPMGAQSVAQLPPVEVRQAPVVPTHGERGTAAYVIAHHGPGPFAEGLGQIPADTFAGLIADYMKANQLPPLRKVAVLACTGGRSHKDMIDQTESEPLIRQLCVQLREHGQYPMVAGWDQFISVCYGQNPQALQSTAVMDAQNAGRKFFKKGSYDKGDQTAHVVSKAYRAKHKRVLRWDALRGDVASIDLTEWTQNKE
jgi:hypothetical protein